MHAYCVSQLKSTTHPKPSLTYPPNLTFTKNSLFCEQNYISNTPKPSFGSVIIKCYTPPFPHHQTHVHNQQEFTFINQTINSLRQSVCFILVNEGDLKLCSITHVLFTSAPCKPAWTDQRCVDAFRQSTPIGQLWLVFFHYMSIT